MCVSLMLAKHFDYAGFKILTCLHQFRNDHLRCEPLVWIHRPPVEHTLVDLLYVFALGWCFQSPTGSNKLFNIPRRKPFATAKNFPQSRRTGPDIRPEVPFQQLHITLSQIVVLDRYPQQILLRVLMLLAQSRIAQFAYQAVLTPLVRRH